MVKVKGIIYNPWVSKILCRVKIVSFKVAASIYVCVIKCTWHKAKSGGHLQKRASNAFFDKGFSSNVYTI